MRLKTGDKVIVITGSNKGKEGIIKNSDTLWNIHCISFLL